MAEQTPSQTDDSDALAGIGAKLFDPQVVACPHAAYKTLRDTCPVSRNPLTGGVLIARYDDVMWALKHPEVFSSAVESLSIGQKRPMIPLQLDPPEQSRYRKILDPLFSRRKMRVLESDMRVRASKLIDAFAERGRCDYNAEFAVPLPSAIFLANPVGTRRIPGATVCCRDGQAPTPGGSRGQVLWPGVGGVSGGSQGQKKSTAGVWAAMYKKILAPKSAIKQLCQNFQVV